MRSITVNASGKYEIRIGPGLLSILAEEVHRLKGVEKVCIVSDTNVYPRYGESITDDLEQKGFTVVSFVFPAGEDAKNGQTWLELLNFLAGSNLTRSDLIVALGGGVPGDLAGFAASVYMRGIHYIQIPTTLLAAVDSSVGGKTAINLPAGKNLAGSFYQPSLVLCDIDTLNTLPEDVFREGCAEVIKYAVLYDEALFIYLENSGLAFDREAVIAKCVEWKRDVVMEDEYDTGARKKLNLGHTIGHSIEAASRFTVSHGRAVSAGTAIVSRACKCADADRIIRLFRNFGLPTEAEYSAEELFHYAVSDKKRSGGNIDLILPRAIGHCDIVSTPVEQLKSLIEAGL